jgi:hypothetical protein
VVLTHFIVESTITKAWAAAKAAITHSVPIGAIVTARAVVTNRLNPRERIIVAFGIPRTRPDATG